MAEPRYPGIWQCVGMIVGVYGIGYAIASRDPYRHWPIVLVGLAGKILGPLGFVAAALAGELPWAFGLTLIPNDLVWWVPFAIILAGAWRRHRRDALRARDSALSARMAMHMARSQTGVSLLSLSQQRPLLVVFLRHLGCTFCREALADLRERHAAIEAAGAGVAIVHMASQSEAEALFARYDLDELPRISDPDRVLYRALRLPSGTLRQLFGLRVWKRALRATAEGHFLGRKAGAGRQLAGVFIIYRGRVLDEFRHRSAADRPDYLGMARGAPRALRAAEDPR
jgi:peroxiredoxin